MKKLSAKPICFSVSLKEAVKYGLSPEQQLERNPMAKILFPRFSARRLILKALWKLEYRLIRLINQIEKTE